MKNYTAPMLDILYFPNEDVLTVSDPFDNDVFPELP